MTTTPTSGVIREIVDAMARQLSTVKGLRVYKYPPASVHEFPAAIIRDTIATNQTTLAEYRSTLPRGVYHLEVLVVVHTSDEEEAYQELEKYISANSPSSIKYLMENTVVFGVQHTECIRAEPRQKHRIGGVDLWGCAFWIRSIGI